MTTNSTRKCCDINIDSKRIFYNLFVQLFRGTRYRFVYLHFIADMVLLYHCHPYIEVVEVAKVVGVVVVLLLADQP